MRSWVLKKLIQRPTTVVRCWCPAQSTAGSDQSCWWPPDEEFQCGPPLLCLRPPLHNVPRSTLDLHNMQQHSTFSASLYHHFTKTSTKTLNFPTAVRVQTTSLSLLILYCKNSQNKINNLRIKLEVLKVKVVPSSACSQCPVVGWTCLLGTPNSCITRSRSPWMTSKPDDLP